MKPFFIFALSLLMMGSTNCSTVPKPDPNVSALEGGDITAFIVGCDHEPVPGYAVCRKREGDASSDIVTLMAPPQKKCGTKESCVVAKIYYPDGSAPSDTYAFPKGETRWQVPWSRLIKSESFKPEHRGFWPVLFSIYWEDEKGRVNLTHQDGEIRLVVFTRNYVPLHYAPHDENYAWSWSEGAYVFRLTTGGRAYVGRADSAAGESQ